MGLMDVCDIYGTFCIAKGTGGRPSQQQQRAFQRTREGHAWKNLYQHCEHSFKNRENLWKKGNLLPLAISPKALKSKSRWLLCSPMGFPPRPRCASSFELLGLVIACLWSSWWWRPTSQVQSWCFHVDLWSMPYWAILLKLLDWALHLHEFD